MIQNHRFLVWAMLAAVLCLPIDERELATLHVRRPAV